MSWLSAITPPQAREVVGCKAKPGLKLPKLVSPQSFCEDIGRLKIGNDMSKVDIPCDDPIPNEVVVHLNVLCPSMEYRVPSQGDAAKIVLVDQNSIVHGDTKVFQDSLKPYGMT